MNSSNRLLGYVMPLLLSKVSCKLWWLEWSGEVILCILMIFLIPLPPSRSTCILVVFALSWQNVFCCYQKFLTWVMWYFGMVFSLIQQRPRWSSPTPHHLMWPKSVSFSAWSHIIAGLYNDLPKLQLHDKICWKEYAFSLGFWGGICLSSA